mgnify:CR=1 FL=1
MKIDAIHIFLDSELCVNLKKSIINSPPTKFTIEAVEDEFLKKWNFYFLKADGEVCIRE